jgi:sugar lactone lactonase YvrE
MRALVNLFAIIITVLCFSLFLVPGFLRADTGTDYQRRTAIAVESPTAVAVDVSENIYIAESSKNRLQIFDYAGVFLGEIAGLAKPLSVAVDNNGRIYIGNDNRNNVEVYNPARNLLFKLGQGDGEFLKPNGIAIDANGNIYVADSDADLIKVYGANGTAKFTFGGTGSTDGKFNFPISLTIDNIAQEIIVVDRQEFTQPGWGTKQGARIQVFDLNGVHIRSFDDLYGENDPEKLNRPIGVTVDRAGLIYVSDSQMQVVQVYDSNGTYVRTLYDLDNPLRTPLGLTVSLQTDKAYIASLNTHRVDIYGLDHTHVVNATAGSGGTITPFGEQTVYHGEFIDFTITPDPGYYLNQVLVNNSPLDNPQKQFRLAIIDDLTIEALFAREISAGDPTPLIIVKPANYVAGEPTTYPLLAGSGEAHTFHAAGGSGTYNWLIQDVDGNVICSQYGIGDSFTINIDDLFSHGAGIYTVVLIDVNDPGTAAIMYVRVPMRISPLFSNHKDTDGTVAFTVSGASGTFSWSLINENGETITDGDGAVISDPSFGTLPPETDTATNSLSLFPGVINDVTTFMVQAQVDDDVLEGAGLDTVVSDPHSIMPVTPFTVQVNDAVDSAPIIGATVTAAHDQSIFIDTDAEGRATLTGLVNTGASYTFVVEKSGYLSATFTVNDLNIAPPTVFLEPIGVEAVITGTVDPAGPCTLVKAKGAGGNFIITSSGNDVQVLANESGEFSLTLDNSQAGTGGLFTIVADRPGYIEGTVDAIAGDTGKVITLQKMTRITIANDGDEPNLTFTITADPSFNGTPEEIQVFNGTAAVAANEVAGALLTYDNAAHSYTYTVAAPEAGKSVSLFVRADTSTSPRNAASGYFATASTTYVSGLTPSTATIIVNPYQGSTTAATSSTGKTSVVLPAGGLDGEILSEVTVTIDEADALTAGIPYDNWSEIAGITMTDSATGEKIDNSNLHKIYISLEFDPEVVTEGGFEAGTWAIYHADSWTDLQDGKASVLPVTQIVKPIDYDSGRVTFWVDHLSVFGIGTVSGGGAAVNGSGGGGGCFIDALLNGSSSNGFYRAVIFLGCLLAILGVLLKTGKNN